ncbi:hypothetical protein [Fodinicola feengrottensis]|uniref:VCBS repeat-containing protein n=1 Tax=Fodinicola feengrottensis TaxID=435914 RepID=A0ABN2IYT6_9ACTN|nr:hypothetical protein [Fodinicola feengrottensis]
MSTDMSPEDRLRESLARRAAATPTPSFTTRALVRRGRRVRRTRQVGAVTAVVASIALILTGIVVGTNVLGHHKAEPVRPAPVITHVRTTAIVETVQLPAIGGCPAGTWSFDGGGTSDSHGGPLALEAKPTAKSPNGDPVVPQHDFNSDGKPEVLRKLTCRAGQRTEAIVAVTKAGSTAWTTLGGPIVSKPISSASDEITDYYITKGSLGGSTYQYIISASGTYAWDTDLHDWHTWGG